MPEIYSFPNNQDEYIGAEHIMRWHHGRTSGVFGAANNAAVSASGEMSVTVSDGLGWLSNSEGNGIVWWNNTEKTNGSKLTLPLGMADGALPRIDRIVVSWQTTNYVAKPTIEVLQGVVSSEPVAPALTNNSTLRQISLAMVFVPAAATSITPSLVTDERLDPSVCGLVTETLTVDTSTMQLQFEALLKSIQNELAQLEAGTAVELKKLVFSNTVVDPASFLSDTTYADYPFRASVGLDGVIFSMIPEVIFGLEDALGGNYAPIAESYDGGIYLYATEVPDAALTIPTIIVWRG